MSNPGKGGYGKRAPYETIHYRIPMPIKPVVKMLADRFRELIGGSTVDPKGDKLIKRVKDAIDLKADESVEHNTNSELSNKPAINSLDDYDEEEEILEEEEAEEAEPSDSEVIKIQAEKLYKQIVEIRMLDREVAELKAKLQSADENLLQYQVTSDLTKSKVATAKTFLQEFLAKSSRESKTMKAKVEEALNLIDSI